MIATHTAETYGGKISLVAVKQDPTNKNMVFGLVVRDHRGFGSNPHRLHTGSRVWVASKQVLAKTA